VSGNRGNSKVDGFRDEDTAYATKLSRAGVQVEFYMHPAALHEFDSIAFGPTSPGARSPTASAP
jgi:acetyl esterase/lipase